MDPLANFQAALAQAQTDAAAAVAAQQAAGTADAAVTAAQAQASTADAAATSAVTVANNSIALCEAALQTYLQSLITPTVPAPAPQTPTRFTRK